jgi:predicted molibdopterin-dependent oxidoreductase YjgC
MTYELILEMGAVRWPCNAQHPRGCERLYEDLNFTTGVDECETWGVDFLSGKTTTRADYARNDPKGKAFLPYVEINPDDAARLEITTGDLVQLTSKNGRWEGVAMVVDTVRRGEVFVPFHYGHGSQAANQHTWYARDAVSQQPHLKSSPVAVRRLSFGQPEPWLLARLEELDGTSIVPFAAREFGDTVNRAVE